jgi:hypothetical protein
MSRVQGWRRLREKAARLSPPRRRWEHFLHDLPLDPADLEQPLDRPGANDFIICGCPRTGTTLLAAVLFQPPKVVTCMEPWDGMRLPPAQLFESLRREMETTGKLTRGRLDLHELRRTGRVRWCREGQAAADVSVEGSWLLGVKWPGYWRYLERLPNTRFIVCLRDPSEVIASFRAAGGRVAQGLQYDTRFNRELNRELFEETDDPALRRVLLFEYVHRRLLPHLTRTEVLIVRYERWFDDRDALLGEISRFLGCSITAGHVALEPPKTIDVLSPRDRELIESRCTTAAQLGYGLS